MCQNKINSLSIYLYKYGNPVSSILNIFHWGVLVTCNHPPTGFDGSGETMSGFLPLSPLLVVKQDKQKLCVSGKQCMQLDIKGITSYYGDHLISTYINTKMSVCVCVLVFAFFSAIWNPIGIPFGTKLPYRPEMVLKQKKLDRRLN